MNKIYRRIRKKFAFENRPEKYLRYALGEIILVVIGILLALQINNWNENNKLDDQAKTYLSDLKTDLEYDIQTINNRLDNNQRILNSIDTIYHIIGSREKLNEEESILFISMHEPLLRESYFIPEKSTIHQIEASSQGNLIKNKTLRDLLFRYYSNHDRNERNGEISIQLYQHNFFTTQFISSIFSNNIVYRKFLDETPINQKFMLEDLKQDKDYFSALFLKRGLTDTQSRVYKELLSSAEEMIILLDQELNEG